MANFWAGPLPTHNQLLIRAFVSHKDVIQCLFMKRQIVLSTEGCIELRFGVGKKNKGSRVQRSDIQWRPHCVIMMSHFSL